MHCSPPERKELDAEQGSHCHYQSPKAVVVPCRNSRRFFALHDSIGRAAIAARIAELNDQFREGMAGIPGATLHTPRDPSVSAGISCFEVAGHTPEQVVAKLAARRYRTTTSPYKVSYARVAAGIMNTSSEIQSVLREIRTLAG